MMYTDVSIIPTTQHIQFSVCDKLKSDAQRVYQHFILLLLTPIDQPYRNQGTSLLSLLQGYNNIPDAIAQVATMAVVQAKAQLSYDQRVLIRTAKAQYNTDQSTPRLIVTLEFVNGQEITRSFQ